jgi:hypothetical protein
LQCTIIVKGIVAPHKIAAISGKYGNLREASLIFWQPSPPTLIPEPVHPSAGSKNCL